ncbi:MAG: hypothetical protein Q8P11_03320 [bacterium]|nr:hypothetical protein [bacterium]
MIAPHLYDFHYWFSSHPGPLSVRGILILSFILFTVIVIDIVSRIIGKKKRKVWDSLTKNVVGRLHNCFVTMIVFGIIVVFFEYEGVPVLGARYFALIWTIVLLVWLIAIGHETYVKNKALRKEAQKKGEFTKYLKNK